MNLIKATAAASTGTGALLICLGFYFQRSNAKLNWMLFVAAGAGMFVFSLLVLTGILRLD